MISDRNSLLIDEMHGKWGNCMRGKIGLLFLVGTIAFGIKGDACQLGEEQSFVRYTQSKQESVQQKINCKRQN